MWFFGQGWPIHIQRYGMQWTISWNIKILILITIYVSGIISKYPVIVKILGFYNNQQVTKFNRKLGTPENICPLTLLHTNNNKIKEKRFNEWLSGVIDADGSLLVSKKGYTSLEITMSLNDEYALQQIKKRLGGSIKLRSGAKALRYRLCNETGMRLLITMINGNIRYKNRIEQLKKVCNVLHITVKEPYKLKRNSGWLSGVWDGDGTITLKEDTGQITVSITNKNKENVMICLLWGGYIYYDKSQNGYYKWSVQDKKGIYLLLENLKESKSNKVKRLRLVKDLIKLHDNKSHLSEKGSLNYKAWNALCNKWKSVIS